MINLKTELAALETGTFEIEEIADAGSSLASAEVALMDGTFCSTSGSCWTSTSGTSTSTSGTGTSTSCS
ncbi:hypothetical protein [Acrocarpospora sp. B8E8]|uniref:hypothetical protein n=1 Tax=Acrocarpospora sp. B8E8 TaxID=3153572 RepID=UPI00325C38FA